MKTYILWDEKIEAGSTAVGELPDSPFECPKLNAGDLLTLDICQPDGKYILNPVKVTKVTFDIEWDASDNVKSAYVSDAEQMLYIEPYFE